MLVAFVTVERQKLCSANDALVFLKQDVSACFGSKETLCEAKVDKKERDRFFALADEYILRFHIAMDEVL